jgi:type III secretory pathway component EscS
MAQMACITLSIVGPLYIAIVMGLLISRYTVQTQLEEESEDEQHRPPS